MRLGLIMAIYLRTHKTKKKEFNIAIALKEIGSVLSLQELNFIRKIIQSMRKLIPFYLFSEQQTTIGEHLFKDIKIRISIYANA